MKKIILTFLVISIVLVLVSIPVWKSEKTVHFTPDYEKMDLRPILEKNSYSQEDLDLLFYQTGLSGQAISDLRNQSAYYVTVIEKIQENFFSPVTVSCTRNSPISKEEELVFSGESPILTAPVQNGDILITSSSHTFFWRNGHSALVVDETKKTTLESVVLGQNSSIQTVRKWSGFPNFILLRPTGLPKGTGGKAASAAMRYFHDIPYDFTVGVFSKKRKAPGEIGGTQCAHLIWGAYDLLGYDLDADGGLIVTPNDLLNSTLLSVVQVYGVDPSLYVDRT